MVATAASYWSLGISLKLLPLLLGDRLTFIWRLIQALLYERLASLWSWCCCSFLQIIWYLFESVVAAASYWSFGISLKLLLQLFLTVHWISLWNFCCRCFLQVIRYLFGVVAVAARWSFDIHLKVDFGIALWAFDISLKLLMLLFFHWSFRISLKLLLQLLDNRWHLFGNWFCWTWYWYRCDIWRVNMKSSLLD